MLKGMKCGGFFDTPQCQPHEPSLAERYEWKI
jgi:hypothetical protein